MKELTQDQVRELFDYRDGNLYWKVRKARRIKIGDKAGTVNNMGYRQVKICDKIHYIHRLVYVYHYGYLSKSLDHMDGDKLNNNISNLREATQQENCRNAKKKTSMNGKPTSSKFKGVYLRKSQRWSAYIKVNEERKYLGLFDSEIGAAKAYNKAAIKYYGEFARLNVIPQPL